MKNIFLLPTDQPSSLVFEQRAFERPLLLKSEPLSITKDSIGQLIHEPQHIYITSSENIKEGDWVLYNNKIVRQVDKTFNKPGFDWNVLNCKKILLTTDPTLIADGVQEISEEFLEWFIKNPTCEFVEVKTDYLLWKKSDKEKLSDCYKITIPQEGYICPHTKIQCDDECCVSAEDCHITSSLASGTVDCEEPKQDSTKECKELEELEELAKNYANYSEQISKAVQEAVKFGAKWQAERMYSEEEVFSILDKVFHMYASNHRKDAKEWFEQFKKK
jgi:hypothetical protein